ncbi:type II toxin-antitoxin system VapC family toxin [Rhizobium sp.]
MSKGLLLDTCAVIWMTRDEWVEDIAADAVSNAGSRGISLYVSPATAWELGMLLARGRIAETRSAKQWYESFRAQAGIEEMAVSADIFIASCSLPQLAHKDPIDRILIATAREHDLTIITRDRAILAYGAAGHVRTLAC